MWADAVPNLLIGLREGLAAGLVVSVLLAAVHRVGGGAAPHAARSVWLGVLAALMLSLSFGAVVTFTRAALSTRVQEGFGGVLSVVAVVLVTGVIFRLRQAAPRFGALAAVAFLAVAGEGPEAGQFFWTAVRASGETVGPVLGAVLGLGVAVALCLLLYRFAVRVDAFVRRAAIALTVIAGGVLAYGIGDLQEAGLVPGHAWLAFDLTGLADSWWVDIVRGVTDLTPSMTWLQVVAYVVYVAGTLTVFLATKPVPLEPARHRRTPTWATPLPANGWPPVTAAVLVPVLAAGVFALVARPGAGSADTQQVTVTARSCGADFTALRAGQRNFTVVNKSGHAGDVYFVRSADSGVLGEAEDLGPGTQQVVTIPVSTGSYQWRCRLSGLPTMRSAVVRTLGGTNVAYPRNFSVPPLDPIEVGGAIKQYQTYVSGQLTVLSGEVAVLRTAIDAGDVPAAERAWLPAQLTWERVGAAYDSFGDLAAAIDDGPDGLPDGVDDPGFTGLRRIEYGLWHGQPTSRLAPYVTKLTADVAELRRKLPQITAQPQDMTIRVHEILEDAQRDHLSGNSDQGAGSGFAETAADVDGTRVVLGELAPLIDQRKPGLTHVVQSDLDTLAQALAATRHHGVWDRPETAPIAERQRVNAAIGQVLEDVSPVPDLLEIGAS